jgi:hypothetical protein
VLAVNALTAVGALIEGETAVGAIAVNATANDDPPTVPVALAETVTGDGLIAPIGR